MHDPKDETTRSQDEATQQMECCDDPECDNPEFCRAEAAFNARSPENDPDPAE